jgi:hypothetical protein
LAYQLSDIRTKVQQRIKDTGYSTSEITNYINDTQNDIFNEYPLKFWETTQNYTLSTGVSDITNGSGLPSDFVRAIDIYLTTSGLENTLIYKDYQEIYNLYPDPTDTTINPSGIPRYWYEYGSTIRVYPAPAGDYTATMLYLGRPTLLANDSDVPALPKEFEEVLIAGAVYRILQVKDNYDQAGVWQNKYDELLQKLVVRYSQRQGGHAKRMRINRNALGES